MANYNPQELLQKDRYKIATGAILPRPIAWVSSMDGAGNLNIAPYSFFTVGSTNPLTLIFCPQTPRPGARKDTLHNVRVVGEFVVNITNESTAVAMNETATSLPPSESEFAYANLTPAPSTAVGVPRIAEAPLAFECTLQQIVSINEEEQGGGAVVFGEVQNIFVQDGIYDEKSGYILLDKLQPIGRLAGNGYVHVTDLFTLIRG